jgi:hypothetical protein
MHIFGSHPVQEKLERATLTLPSFPVPCHNVNPTSLKIKHEIKHGRIVEINSGLKPIRKLPRSGSERCPLRLFDRLLRAS